MTICPNAECRHLMITAEIANTPKGIRKLLVCPFCGERRLYLNGDDITNEVPRTELLAKNTRPNDYQQKAKAKKFAKILEKWKDEK